MEYALPHLMTREDIVHVLSERHLKIPLLEQLPYDELLRIYRNFIVPLAKRSSKKDDAVLAASSNPIPLVMQEVTSVYASRLLKRHYPQEETMKIANNQNQDEAKMSKIIKTTISVEKRPNEQFFNGFETNISAASAKRKKITWP